MQKKDLIYFLNIFKTNCRYNFIKDIKIQEILYLFSAYVSYIYYIEIGENNNSNELNEIKSHTIFVYLGSIIESVIYEYIKSKLTDEKSKRKYLEIEELKKLQKIKETEKLYICKLETKKIDFNNSINFNALINGAKDKKIIEKNILKKIDNFRKMRNLVHINAFLNYDDDEEIFKKLNEAFIDTKEILDYIENNI